MFCVFVIPDYLKAENYLEINQIDEIRPFELLKVNEKLSQAAQSICFMLKEMTKNTKIDLQDIFKNTISKFILNERDHPKRSFKDLIDHIEIESSKIRKELELDSSMECINPAPEESFVFLDHFYCCINSGQSKAFGKMIDLRTSTIVDRTEDKILYKVYCLKRECEEMKSVILNKLGKDASIQNTDKIQLIDTKTTSKELIGRTVENMLLSVVYNGLSESLDKCGIDSFKYKFTYQSKMEKEIKNLKKMNKDCDLDEIITIVDFSLI